MKLSDAAAVSKLNALTAKAIQQLEDDEKLQTYRLPLPEQVPCLGIHFNCKSAQKPNRGGSTSQGNRGSDQMSWP
ncbi:MAG: hypothetical protein U5K51_16955 [Flavobacteriaceae bacterium]|nr:hypothetical protein [Flavobacteriaceae bacterium]